ncbi:MAG: Rrf2 family transcriptional regulator [Proteobacteria bacterium]|nr:Rrf2 family transcriptional regulator [Pseudomonadota bacterium]MBU1688521.1 Rrf2 family transcriptional regulator [Pseudomonadota bacterium]
MRLTRAGEYAVRCILYLSHKGRGQLVSRLEIAAQCDIPDKFLAKIAQQLGRSGLIEIRQGARGGYRLIKDPAEISLLDVVETIIGEISLNDCVTSADTCRASANCAVNRIWIKARNQLRQTLAEVSFEALLQEDSCFLFPGTDILDNRKNLP